MDEIEERAIKKAEENVYLITENLGDLEKKESYDIMLKFVKYGIRLMREEMLEEGMNWQPIDRDENGFTTEECLDKIFNNLPCAVCLQTEGGYKYYNFVNKYLDMCHNREDIRTNTGYTHYLPIPKLEV